MQEPLTHLIERTFSAAERGVIYRLIRSRQHIRHFAADPIPPDTLLRILEAALYAPSVGGMPSWHVILITSSALRAKITAAFDARHEGDTYTCPDHHGQGVSGSHTRERMAEAPLHVAITYDRRRGGAVVLDRGLGPTMDIYHIYLAIQNMWLAACAEGLGVEWVRLSDDGEVTRFLELPCRVQLIAYLCLGIPQEFHVRPRRAAVDWRSRKRLDSLIYKDSWGQTCELPAASMPPADDHAQQG